MIIVRNNIFPASGFLALTVWPFIFVRKSMAGRFDEVALRHEAIHGRQQLEMLWLPFFVWYGVEWLIRVLSGKGNAYRRISLEREAYDNERNVLYLQSRRLWAWLRYI